MFPVSRGVTEVYRTDGNVYAALIKSIIDANEKRIVSECQAYLDRYERGERPAFATDIDQLLELVS